MLSGQLIVKIGYTRVSTVDQDAELQITALITLLRRSQSYSMP